MDGCVGVSGWGVSGSGVSGWGLSGSGVSGSGVGVLCDADRALRTLELFGPVKGHRRRELHVHLQRPVQRPAYSPATPRTPHAHPHILYPRQRTFATMGARVHGSNTHPNRDNTAEQRGRREENMNPPPHTHTHTACHTRKAGRKDREHSTTHHTVTAHGHRQHTVTAHGHSTYSQHSTPSQHSAQSQRTVTAHSHSA